MIHPIQFVSLGPGDAELITLKGLKALQNADIIYCPGTSGKDGLQTSRSASIINELDINTSVQIFHVPMSKDRSEAIQVYDNLCKKIFTHYQSGKKIAVVAEGDSGFYSSVQYLYDKLATIQVPLERIAGIPAFIAAGAWAGLHIVKQEEHFHIIPGNTTEEELSELIQKGYTIVIMKMSQSQDIIRKFIIKHPEMNYHYFENIGLLNEFYTSDRETIRKRDFPYFSLLIVK